MLLAKSNHVPAEHLETSASVEEVKSNQTEAAATDPLFIVLL
jgi:hypothetical protein